MRYLVNIKNNESKYAYQNSKMFKDINSAMAWLDKQFINLGEPRIWDESIDNTKAWGWTRELSTCDKLAHIEEIN